MGRGWQCYLFTVKWEKIFNKTPTEIGPSGPSKQSPQSPKLPASFLDEVDEDDLDVKETSVKTKNIKRENLEKWTWFGSNAECWVELNMEYIIINTDSCQTIKAI